MVSAKENLTLAFARLTCKQEPRAIRFARAFGSVRRADRLFKKLKGAHT